MILIITKILNNAWYCLVLTQKVTMLSLKNYAQQKLNPPREAFVKISAMDLFIRSICNRVIEITLCQEQKQKTHTCSLWAP